jgi:hypothetical protein
MSNGGQIAVGWISVAHPPCVANKVGAIFKVDALRLSTLPSTLRILGAA